MSSTPPVHRDLLTRHAGTVALSGALAWLAVLAVIDALTNSVNLATLFSVAPLLAATALPPPTIAGLGGLATGLAILSGAWDDTLDDPQQWVRVVTVALLSAAAVAVSAIRVRREKRVARLVAIADAAQRAVLPAIPRSLPGVAVSARYESAAEDALVGGDLYDAIQMDGVVRIIIGDVRGKGLGAVQESARVIRAFRQFASAASDIAQVAKQMNDYLMPFLGDEDFVTALLVECAPDGGLTLVCCGHHPPFLARGGDVQLVTGLQEGLPFGLADSFDALHTRWDVEDRLLLYTDGLMEARDRNGSFLRTEAVIAALLEPSEDDVLDHLIAGLHAHTGGGMSDDLAVVLAVRKASDPA
jgi:sigma-B regulation protein RsbU (phosphoserine phosphatase)